MKGKLNRGKKRETKHYYSGHVAKIILKGKLNRGKKRETKHYYSGHVAKIILKGKLNRGKKRETEHYYSDYMAILHTPNLLYPKLNWKREKALEYSKLDMASPRLMACSGKMSIIH